MDVYVARQPIFDVKKNIYAYELLFRDGALNCVSNIDGDTATEKVLTNSFFTIGLDTILGGKKAFINFTQNLLVQKTPLLLPKAQTVVEVLEDVVPEPEVIEACKEIVEKGYLIALDDFEYSEKLLPLIKLANIIKFDFYLTPIEQIKSYLQNLPASSRILLAEKIETNAEFNLAKSLGFTLFQGYFFQKPEIIQGREIIGSQLTLLQIMAECSKPEFEFDKLETLISQDISLSYKLLQYINSAFFSKTNKISSIRQGLVFLGEKEIRRFISLATMSKLAVDKPHEIIRVSSIRGKFCELLGQEAPHNIDSSELFMVGMFSLLDAIIDQPMNRIMSRLPLSKAVGDALVHNRGPLAGYLNLVKEYENGNWSDTQKYASSLGIAEDVLPTLYFNAVKWCQLINCK
jgi:EAL and modified HD-GYP domain-containing signal transduction protein